jgi:hypothetical protein
MGLGHFDHTNQMITLSVITLLSHFNCIAQQNKILTYPSTCVNLIEESFSEEILKTFVLCSHMTNVLKRDHEQIFLFL